MADPDPNASRRELDVARSLLDMSNNIGGGQIQSQNHNLTVNQNAPPQGQDFRGQPGRARAARTRAARRGRGARAAAQAGQGRNRSTAGRNGRRQQVAAQPAAPIAAMPPRAQPRPQVQVQFEIQPSAINSEYTLQGHLIRQQLLAGIAPENVVTLPARAPDAPNGNANIDRHGTPSVIQFSNAGVFVPRIPPATFIPPTPYPVYHGPGYQRVPVPVQPWTGNPQQHHQAQVPRRPVTALGSTTFERAAYGPGGNASQSTNVVPWIPLLASQAPKNEVAASAEQSVGIPAGIPHHHRPTSVRPAASHEANMHMNSRPDSNEPKMEYDDSFGHPLTAPGGKLANHIPISERSSVVSSPVSWDVNPFSLDRILSRGAKEHKREGSTQANPIRAPEQPLQHGTRTLQRPAGAVEGHGAGYPFHQPGSQGPYAMPAYTFPHAGYDPTPTAQVYQRSESVAYPRHGYSHAATPYDDDGYYAQNAVTAPIANDFNSPVLVKTEPGIEHRVGPLNPIRGHNHGSSASINDGPRLGRPDGTLINDKAHHEFDNPVFIKAEAGAGLPVVGISEAPADHHAGYAPVKTEAVNHGRQTYILDPNSHHRPSMSQFGPNEGFPATFQPDSMGLYSTASDQFYPQPGLNHFQQPIVNVPIVSGATSQKPKALVKQEPVLKFVSQHANPVHRRPGFKILVSLLDHPEIAVMVTGHLDLQDLISLQKASRASRNFVIKYLPGIVRYQALGRHRMTSRIFPWRCYSKLWFRRVIVNNQFVPLTAADPANSIVAYTASFLWLKMVRHRERTVNSILIALRRAGYGYPRTYSFAIFKLWFLMDIPDNHRREWTVGNRNLWTDLDLFMAIFFIVRIDMFVKIKRNNRTGGQRRLILAQPGLELCQEVLNGRALTNNIELLQALVRWRYVPRPGEVIDQEIFGVPVAEIGSLQYEGYGRNRETNVKLRRPDELILREANRRGLDAHEMYRRIFIHGQARRFMFCERPNSLWDEEVKIAIRHLDVPAQHHLRLN